MPAACHLVRPSACRLPATACHRRRSPACGRRCRSKSTSRPVCRRRRPAIGPHCRAWRGSRPVGEALVLNAAPRRRRHDPWRLRACQCCASRSMRCVQLLRLEARRTDRTALPARPPGSSWRDHRVTPLGWQRRAMYGTRAQPWPVRPRCDVRPGDCRCRRRTAPRPPGWRSCAATAGRVRAAARSGLRADTDRRRARSAAGVPSAPPASWALPAEPPASCRSPPRSRRDAGLPQPDDCRQHRCRCRCSSWLAQSATEAPQPAPIR